MLVRQTKATPTARVSEEPPFLRTENTTTLWARNLTTPPKNAAQLKGGSITTIQTCPHHQDLITAQYRKPASARVRAVPHFHFPHRLRKSKSRAIEVRTPKFLADLLSTLNVRRVGLVIMRVTSVFGVPHVPQRLCPAASTWVTNIDFLAHLHKLVVQVIQFRSLDSLVYGYIPCSCFLSMVASRWVFVLPHENEPHHNVFLPSPPILNFACAQWSRSLLRASPTWLRFFFFHVLRSVFNSSYCSFSFFALFRKVRILRAARLEASPQCISHLSNPCTVNCKTVFDNFPQCEDFASFDTCLAFTLCCTAHTLLRLLPCLGTSSLGISVLLIFLIDISVFLKTFLFRPAVSFAASSLPESFLLPLTRQHKLLLLRFGRAFHPLRSNADVLLPRCWKVPHHLLGALLRRGVFSRVRGSHLWLCVSLGYLCPFPGCVVSKVLGYLSRLFCLSTCFPPCTLSLMEGIAPAGPPVLDLQCPRFLRFLPAFYVNGVFPILDRKPLHATTQPHMLSTSIPSWPFDLHVDTSAAGTRMINRCVCSQNHFPQIQPTDCFQQGLISCSPTFRVPEVDRTILKAA